MGLRSIIESNWARIFAAICSPVTQFEKKRGEFLEVTEIISSKSSKKREHKLRDHQAQLAQINLKFVSLLAT